MLRTFRRDTRAATAIEYGMMAGVLGVAILLAGGKLKDVMIAKLNELTFASSSMRVENCQPSKPCDQNAQGGGAATGQASGLR